MQSDSWTKPMNASLVETCNIRENMDGIGSYSSKKLHFDTPGHFIEKIDKIERGFRVRKGPYLKWLDENNDLNVFKPPAQDYSNGIPTLSYHLADLETGVAFLAARSNRGKSSFIVSCMMGALTLNDDTIVLDFSLDDHDIKRYTQYLANLSGVPYYKITMDTPVTDAEVAAIQKASVRVRDWVSAGRLRFYQSMETYGDAEKMQTKRMRNYGNVTSVLREVRQQNPTARIIAVIDAWNNLDTTTAKGFSELNQQNNMLEHIQEEVLRSRIVMWATAHLRKLDTTYPVPTLDDLKGSSDLAFDSQFTGALVNEVKDDYYLEPMVYKQGKQLYPIVYIKTLKNKVTGHAQPLFYPLFEDRCALGFLTEEEYLGYLEIYESDRKAKRRTQR